jgi:hypothetical protein
VPVYFRAWNGHPLNVSPVAGLLWELGFRFDGRGGMRWPPPRHDSTPPPPRGDEAFLPYYLEPPPVEYGPDWTVSRARPAVRPVLRALLDILSAELDRRGWDLQWRPHGPEAIYGAGARLSIHCAQRWVDVNVRAASWRAFHTTLRVATPADLSDSFAADLAAALARAEELADRPRANRGARRE